MDTRIQDSKLQLAVQRSLCVFPPHITRSVSVIACPDGSVWLKGRVNYHSECRAIEKVVKQVKGVSQVFCNIAAQF